MTTKTAIEKLYEMSQAIGATVEELQTCEELSMPLTRESVDLVREARREARQDRREWDQARGCWVSETTVAGCQIQYDNSGVGHNWRDIDASDIPANIREEIECEIIEGGKEECDDYVASNGLHYRWS